MEEILTLLLNWVIEDGAAVLVTVIDQRGSAPRSVGAKMVVRSNSDFSGSVSGGCVEGDVILLTKEVLKNKNPKVMEYGISDDQAWSVGLICGGQINVLLQPVFKESGTGVTYELLQQVQAKQVKGEKFCLITVLSGDLLGNVCLVSNGVCVSTDENNDNWVSDQLLSMISDREKIAESGIITDGTEQYFLDWFIPQSRLVVIGGGHVAIHLVKIANWLGYFTVLIDPRRIFASPDRFKDVDMLINLWPEQGFEEISLSEIDFLVIMSHDDKLDLPALSKGLREKCRYIGMLSSRKARDRRFEELISQGFSKHDLQVVHSPVGLDIGSSTPEEIALSIMAEITAIKHGKKMSQ